MSALTKRLRAAVGPTPFETAVLLNEAALTIDELAEALRALVSFGCPACGGDCGSANPPVVGCPYQQASAALAKVGL